MAKLIRVDPLFPPLWEAAKEYLNLALEVGGGKRDWDVEDVYEGAVKNSLDVFVLTDADGIFGACCCVLNHYPKRKTVDVLLLGTDPHREDGWRECLEELLLLARSVGATMVTGTGRPGWARKLGCKERRVFELEVPQ